MQYFSQQTVWRPQWFRRYDMAHSPQHWAISETKELRSKLFPERRYIPARKGKLLMAVAVSLQFLGLYHYARVKKQQGRKVMESQKLQRKALPFLQAMADIRHCSLQEKYDILVQELFAYRGQDYINKITNIYFQKDIWLPYKPRQPHMYTRTSKDPYPYTHIPATRYMHGLDVYNI